MLDYLADLESDFSVFHRVDDMYGMEARDFLRKAVRITAYQGVMAVRVMEERDMSGGQRSDEVESSRTALSSSDAFRSVISWGGGSGG